MTDYLDINECAGVNMLQQYLDTGSYETSISLLSATKAWMVEYSVHQDALL